MTVACLIFLILTVLSAVGFVVSLVSMIKYFRTKKGDQRTKGKTAFHIIAVVACNLLANTFAFIAFLEWISYGIMMSM